MSETGSSGSGSGVRVVIDTRERQLLQLFRDEAESSNLDVGDVCVFVGGELVLAIERKTLSDLAASIKDGRHREQKLRLLSSLGSDRVLYVIEGRLSYVSGNATQGIPHGTLVTCVINSLVRDRLRVVQTKDIEDTAAFIKAVVTRIRRHGIPPLPTSATSGTSGTTYREYASSLKTRKKDNLNPQVGFIMQLRQVPGVSDKTAHAISAEYRSMRDLCARGTAEALASVRIGKRRLGERGASTICEHLGLDALHISEMLKESEAKADSPPHGETSIPNLAMESTKSSVPIADAALDLSSTSYSCL